MEIQEPVCPRCRSTANTIAYYLITVSFVEWRMMLLIGASVAAVGLGLQLGFLSAIGFGIAATVPLAMQLSRKVSCDRCGVHFDSKDPNAEGRTRKEFTETKSKLK